MDCPDSGQVDPDAAGSFEAPHNHEPAGEEEEVIAGQGEVLDVGQLQELHEGPLLRVEGLAGPVGPGARLQDGDVVTEDPNGA